MIIAYTCLADVEILDDLVLAESSQNGLDSRSTQFIVIANVKLFETSEGRNGAYKEWEGFFLYVDLTQ